MTSFLTPTGRQPRGAVKIYSAANTNGELINACLEMEIDNNNFYSADTFRCVFDAGQLPTDRNADWFSSQQDMYVELFIGFPADAFSFTVDELQSWIYGQVDEIDFDIVRNTITVSGRDLTRVFIDTKTTQKWPNQTASQIVTQLAQAHGLTPVVAATTTLAGKYYEIDHVNIEDERSEWDILNYFAGVEGMRVWVRGQSLYFQPAPDPATATPYQVIWTPPTSTTSAQANFMHVNFKRALTVSRGIQVIIRSWNKKQAHGFVATWPAKVRAIQAGKSTVGSGAQIYSRTIPNLTQEKANQYAQNWYAQLIAHELKFENLVMPGDNGLDITSIISLSGTGTAFDQQYFPDSIHRSLNFEDGYQMVIAAKNHSPESATGAL